MVRAECFRIVAVGFQGGTARLDCSVEGDGAVTVLIGANGTGKSTLLGDVARAFGSIAAAPVGTQPPEPSQGPRRLETIEYAVGANRFVARFAYGALVASVRNGDPCGPRELAVPACVVASTISPFDKFPLMSPVPVGVPARATMPYVYAGARRANGHAGVQALLDNAFDILGSAAPERPRSRADLRRVFAFLGFAPRLSFLYRSAPRTRQVWAAEGAEQIAGALGRLVQEQSQFRSALHRALSLDGSGLERLTDAVRIVGAIGGSTRVLQVEAEVGTGVIGVRENELSRAIMLLRSAGLLVFTGAEAARVGVSEQPLNLQSASSGQLSILITFLGLALTLRDGGLVLIDEPELSLHPAWQQAYLDILRETFAAYRGCHFVVATHSPLIVGDAPRWGASVVRLENGTASSPDLGLEAGSADSVLVNAFGVASDGNYYVRDLLACALRMTYGGEIGTDAFAEALRELQVIRRLLTSASPVGRAIDDLASARASIDAAR